jgi:hypothetical protein
VSESTDIREPLHGAEADAVRDRLREHHLTTAKELISDIEGIDHVDERRAFQLLGRAAVVIDSLVKIIEGSVR